MANVPSPEQLLAIQAMLQQGAVATQGAAENVALTLAVAIQKAAINVDNIVRVMVLEGTAIAADLDQVILKTAQGEFLLKSQQMNMAGLLPARATLQLRPGPNGIEAVLVVNNRAVPAKPLESLGGGNVSGLSRQTLTPEIPKVGQVHQVLILPSTLFASQTPSSDGKGQKAAAPALPLTMNAPEIAGIGKVQNNVQAAAQESLAPPAKATPQQETFKPSAAATLGEVQTTTIKIVKIMPPDAPVPVTPAPATSAPAEEQETVLATVRGNTPSGQPILTVGEQTLAVRAPRGWPVGTQMHLAIGPGAALLTDRELAALEPRQWESLRQGLEILAQQNPTFLRETAGLRMPQAQAPQMAGAMLFFFNAMQKGTIQQWLGQEFAQKLESLGRADLVRKIQEEWQGRHIPAEDQQGGAWKGVAIPYMDQDKMHNLRFYVHDQPHGHKHEGRDWARRFLIDVSLSRLGPVQLEGLVHKKKLDLVVRTREALDAGLQNDLNARFIKAMEEVRYTGSLTFRTGAAGWVEIKEKHAVHVMAEI